MHRGFGNYIKWPPSGKYVKELIYKKKTGALFQMLAEVLQT